MSTATLALRKPLGEILVHKNLITNDQLLQALDRQKERGLKLGQVLVEQGLLSEVDLAEALSDQGSIPSIMLDSRVVDRRVAEQLGAEISWNHKAIAIHCIAGTTTVAMEDPSDGEALESISQRLDTPVFPIHALPEAIRSCLETFFPKGFAAPSGLEDIVGKGESEQTDLALEYADVAFDADEPDQQPVTRLVYGILEDALAARASDIHLEPRRERFSVRFRVDGTLLERLDLSRSWLRPLLTRLKVMAKLDIAQKRLPQDGRIQVDVQGKIVDLRLATISTLHGEGAVLRVLDGGRSILNLDQLGLENRQREDLAELYDARDGFVLAVGPTGSGKTTTLYSVLKALNTPDRKLITIEDPVENELEGAFQIDTSPKIGLDFPTALRSVLRLDPDVVLVGEIRDQETAHIAVQAALTGHLVLSTLSTSGSAETVTRLRDMGIPRDLLADTIRGIVSQRLVRRICGDCKAPVTPPQGVREALGLEGSHTYYAGRGCVKCLNTGYHGRVAVYEILKITRPLYDLISRGASAGDVQQRAAEGGMMTLREAGLIKARSGETTLEEVLQISGGIRA